MKKEQIIPLGIILFIILTSFYYYPKLPDKIATHWNVKGEVDGYSNKKTFMFLFSGLLIGLYLLFLVIPKIDPLAHNIEKFIKHYHRFIIMVFLFMAYIHMIILFANLGHTINMNYIILPALSIIF